MAEPILSAVMFALLGIGGLYYYLRRTHPETKVLPEARQSPSPYREESKYSLQLRSLIAHEAGHAILAWYSSYVIRIEEIQITRSHGHVKHVRRVFSNMDSLYDTVVSDLAGLAAEVIVIGKIGSAFESRHDLRRARKGAIAIVMEAHRPIVQALLKKYGEEDIKLDIAAMFTRTLQPDVRILLNAAYIDAKKRILDHRAGFDRLQKKLLVQRTLHTADIEKLFGPRPWAP